jgi:acid phosphatase
VRTRWLVLSAGILLAASGCLRAARIPTPELARPEPARGLAHERLHAALWLHTSAEYPATATQVFRMALGVLEAALADPGWSAIAPDEMPREMAAELPPAVIADVDETLLQNVGFERALLAENVGMDTALLASWIRKAEATAVPGARELFEALSERGVVIFYVTNRSADEEQATLRNLTATGFPVEGGAEQILMLGERPEWSADKSSRRRWIASHHRVLLLLGDTLGDFVSDEGLSPAARRALGERHAQRWGVTWFMLPNPAYGGWEAAARGQAQDDLEALRKKRELLSD